MTVAHLLQRLALSLLLGFAVHGGAFAADAFQGLVDQSYGAYRTALFKTNANDKAGTLEALGAAKSSWSKVVASYRNSPPSAYAADREFAPSLDRITSMYERAQAQASEGALADAHETLEGIRDTLGEMRHRNGLIVFSDHINAYHSEMERTIGGEIPADDLQGLAEQAGILRYLDKQIRENAPRSHQDDPNFQKLSAENTAAIDRLRKALETRNAAEIKNALGGLKPAYSKLFLAFG